MQICGFNRTTLLDFPEHVACTVFAGGCNFRCPFCQNGDLVLHGGDLPLIGEEEVFEVLHKRVGILAGVCVTGGEPTLQKDLDVFLSRVKDLGYLVKLDSNGYRPEVLQSLFDRGLVDYFAMDIKNSPENYARTAGVETLDMGRIRESVDFIRSCGAAYEFRTTVVRELHCAQDFLSVGKWLQGCRAYFLQSYAESDGVICKEFSSYTKEELEEFAVLLKPYISNVSLRGVD